MMAKKVPMRLCLGCREMKPKSDLIRFVKSPEETISLDFSGKKPGRGAYVCHSIDCFNRVNKSKALSRAFKMQISEDIMDDLQKELMKQPECPV